MAKDDLTRVTFTLQLLQRMMDGERLTAATASDDAPLGRQAVLRRLQCMVEALKGVHRNEPGPGAETEFWWEWPDEQRTDPSTVWALAAARALLHPWSNAPIGQTLRDLLADQLSRLPPDADAGPPDVSRMFFVNTSVIRSRLADGEVIDRLARCIFQRRLLAFHYLDSKGRERDVVVEPWSLIVGDDAIYLYGLCVETPLVEHLGQRRLHNVQRMSKLRIQQKHFAYPERSEFDPERLFEHSFGIFLPAEDAPPPGPVVLRFAPALKHILQSLRVHPSQDDPVALDDGCVEIRMMVHITYDLVRWIRGLGEEVEVIEPESLRRWVQSGKGAAYRKELDL